MDSGGRENWMSNSSEFVHGKSKQKQPFNCFQFANGELSGDHFERKEINKKLLIAKPCGF